MAKKSILPDKFPIPFPQGNSLPPDQLSQLQGAYNAAASDYALRPYSDIHPYKAALAGFLSNGLGGALSAGTISNAYRQQQQEKDIKDWNDAYSNALKNQQVIDASSAPRNYTEGKQTQLDALRKAGYVGNDTPDIYPRSLPSMDGSPYTPTRPPYMDTAQTDALFKSAAGGSDIQALANNLPGFTQSGMNVTSRVSAKPGTLQGNVGSYEPQLPPVIVNPDALQAQLAAGYQTGLGQGTERYKFDQEAPKRLAEVQKLILEGKTEQAKAALTGAQTKSEAFKPQLLKAQANSANSAAAFNARRYAGGPSGNGSNNPLVNLGRTQEILQRQKQAILSQMLQNGFIEKKTGLIKPPTPEGASPGLFGWGAHGDNKAKVDQFNTLQSQLNNIDGQLTGGTAPQQIYPPVNPKNPAGITKHPIKGGGSVEY